jgi:pSer/pThr/pTyr-binding forkhead associated (FHA) protein
VAQLVILTGPRAGETIAVHTEIVIGRGQVDIAIDDPKLSRRHALIRPVEDGLEIEDLGSLNGTVVDGNRITEPVRVRGGEQVKLGESTIEIAADPPEEDATVLESRPEIGRTVITPPPAVPEVPVPAAQAAPAPGAQIAPETPFAGAHSGGSAARASTHRRTAYSLLWGPTVVCVLIVVATAVAIVLYFALRTPPP